jgi:hypothetical protein
MPGTSPYLWKPPHEPMAPITVRYDVGSATSILTIRGTWTIPLWSASSAALRKCYAGHPDALIVDLTELDDPEAASAPTWLTAQRRSSEMDPPVRLALCISPELILADRMQRLGARRFLPVYARVNQARVAIASRLLLTDQVSLDLSPAPGAPQQASAVVDEACRSWELTPLADPARMIVTELVHNAVEHAGTDITVQLTRRPTGLTVAVSDRDPNLPHLRTPTRPKLPRGTDPGRGLQLVHTIAIAWGAMPTAHGKVVWAAVQLPIALR